MATKTMDLEKAKFSYTGLRLYDACPGAWSFQYGPDRKEKRRSDALMLGGAVHMLTAIYDSGCMAKGVETDITAGPEMFRAFMDDHPDLASFRPEIKAIFDGYVASHIVEPTLRAVEKYIEIPELSFRGRLDRLYYDPATKAVRIRDLKTDGQIRSQSEIDSDFQLSSQALLAARSYHVNSVEVEMEFVHHGVVKKSVRTAEAIDETAADIQTRIKQIRGAAQFPFTPGTECGWCSYISDCPKWKQLWERGTDLTVAVGSRVDAERLGAELIVLKARSAQIKDALNPWCSANGNLEINGMEIGHHKVESYDYPADAVESVLKHFDFTPILFMRTDKDKVEGLMDRNEGVKSALYLIRTDASYTQFRMKKIKAKKPGATA